MSYQKREIAIDGRELSQSDGERQQQQQLINRTILISRLTNGPRQVI